MKINKRAFALDTSVCQVGKTRIKATRYGRVVHISQGRTNKSDGAAEEYLAARPKLKTTFEEWLKWRGTEIERWKATNPHAPFSCDGGALLLTISGVKVRVDCGGDGKHNFYITNNDPIRPEFERTNITIDGPATINVFAYDYGDEIADSFKIEDGEKLLFWRGHDGDIALQIVGAEKEGRT